MASAPLCAAESIPRAMPLTMVSPAWARSLESRSATARPYGVGRRVPTTASEIACNSSTRPRVNSTMGGSKISRSRCGYRGSLKVTATAPASAIFSCCATASSKVVPLAMDCATDPLTPAASEAERRVACISGGSLGASLFCLGRVTIHPPSFPDAGDQLRLPFLQLGNLDLQPLQFAIDARQFRFRLPILQMAVPVLLNDQRFHFTPKKPQPRVPVHRGNPVLQRASLRRSVDLFLRQPKLLPRRLVAEGRSLARPF